jgi:tagatose-1,6-bisphosphate aldolase
LKIDLVAALAAHASGVMLEPEYSIPQVIDAGVLPPGVGFTAALEDQGYLDDPSARPTRILPGWSVAQAQACGAAAAKLLLPYVPGTALAAAQESFAADVAAEARDVGLPLLLEPLAYGISDPDEHARVVVETARRFAGLGAALVKLPFPGGGKVGDREAAAACAEITAAIDVSWALLSGGGSFDAFAAQLAVARAAGCAGFMVGRALWGDAVTAPPGPRRYIVAAERLDRLAAISRSHRG